VEPRAPLGGDVDVELRQVSVLDCSADWPTMAFDAVACVEVLEHLPSEAHAARAGAALLRLARRLAVFTTPRSEANAAMRAAAGFPFLTLEVRRQVCSLVPPLLNHACILSMARERVCVSPRCAFFGGADPLVPSLH